MMMKNNKARTALTVLGIVIGIASVIIVFSAGEGINGLVLNQIESFGTDIIETETKVPTMRKGIQAELQTASSIAQGVQITTLTLDDMTEINKLPNIKSSYAGILSQEQVSYGNELRKAFVFGASASYIEIDKSEIGEGRFFTEAEDKSLEQVVVLGYKMKNKLFGESDSLGKSIKIRKEKFRVIGIMKERGAVMTMDFDDYVYAPIRTLQKKLMGIDHVLYMVHQIENLNLAEQTADQIIWLLRTRHNIVAPESDASGKISTNKDDFRVMTMKEMLKILDTITNAITLLLLAIVAISLVVGGVGIVNVMYVVVTERTKEIGLRKAVGAQYKDIMLQFLVESILITIIGGIIGIIIGVAVSYFISLGAHYFGLDWRFFIPLKAYFIALGFSSFFGILFGIYPARLAARMDPIEALRHE